MPPGIYPGHMSFLPHKSAAARHPVDAGLTTLLSALFHSLFFHFHRLLFHFNRLLFHFHRLFFHFNRQLQIGLLIFIKHACVKGIRGILA